MRTIALLAALALAGCGAGGSRAQARTAVERFYAAYHRHDGRAACAQLSAGLRSQLAGNCAETVLKLRLHDSATAAVRVYATSAQVVLAHGDTVFLGVAGGGWRIDALGCRPRDGGPYECEEPA